MDIFISYKRENVQAVQRLVQALREANLSVWWDQDIAPSAPWEATIETELESANVVIVCWSKAAAASENVKAEARRARDQGKLIQVFLEVCDPPLFFGERQGINLTDWGGDSTDRRFKAIVDAARAIKAGRSPPQGVGYTPAKRRTPWGVFAAIFVTVGALISFLADLGGARDALCSVVSVDAICTAEDSRRPTQDDLLESMNGVWSNVNIEPRCSSSMIFEASRGRDGVARIRATAEGFDHTSQVISIDTAARVVVAQGVESDTLTEYRIEGDRMDVRGAETAPSALQRCR